MQGSKFEENQHSSLQDIYISENCQFSSYFSSSLHQFKKITLKWLYSLISFSSLVATLILITL